MGYYSLAVFDYSGNKLCDLCDSTIAQNGRAYNIKTTTEQNGWKELSFDLPLKTDGVKNYRWDFIKSDYLIRLLDDDREDWFIIQKPKPARSATAITQSVTCPHISSTLKTKKLYQTFDEENGIGTLPYLVDQVLVGTGWRRGRYETFYEADGVTIKVRSVESDGKEGAYSLITKICELFQAYPVFNGDKTIDFFNLKSHRQEWEFIAGINTNNVTVSYNSSDLITRMYVEGDYDQNSYVGIDSVNPTGLNFLVNFDYYKDIGLFTSEHQTALDTYISNVSSIKQQIETNTSNIMMYENVISRNVGDIPFMVGDLRSGTEQDVYINGATSESTFVKTLYVHSNSTHSETQQAGDKFKLCYVQKAKGQIGAKEVGIETKQIMIDSWQEKITSEQQKSEPSQEKITEYTNKITELNTQITTIQNELDPLVNSLCIDAIQLDKYLARDTTLNNTQNDIEIAFANAMGDMLKDGLMENKNYAPGQEISLYADAIDRLKRMSHPVAEYTIGYVSAKDVLGVGIEDLSINSVGHIIDDDITINTKGYIKKIVRDYDKEDGGSITLTTDDLSLSATTLSAVISRITDISNLFDRNESIYGRAGNFDSDGTLLTGRLKGKLDAAVTQLSAVTSNWYTDERGNIIFESTSGDGAMMLCGEGWMVANGKNASGNWNWRTVGTGSGIVADEITTGFLSAERILAGTITAEKIESGYGAVIDLSGNAIVTTLQNYANGSSNDAQELAKEFVNNALYTGDGGTQFVRSTATMQTADAIVSTAVAKADTAAGNKFVRSTAVLQTAEAIVSTATSEASTAAGRTYIAKTETYQTADSIVQTAEKYVDDTLTSYSKITQTSQMISAVVSTQPTTFRQPEAPVSTTDRPLVTGDLWIDTDDGNKLYTYDAATGGWSVANSDAVYKTAQLSLDNQGRISIESSELGHLGTYNQSGIYMTPTSITAKIASGGSTRNSIIIDQSGIEITSTGKFLINSNVLTVDNDSASINGTLTNNGSPVMTRSDIIFSSTKPTSNLRPGMIWLCPTGETPSEPTEIKAARYFGVVNGDRQTLQLWTERFTLLGSEVSAPGGTYTYSFTGTVDCVNASSSSNKETVTIALGLHDEITKQVSVDVSTCGTKDISFTTTSQTWVGGRSVRVRLKGGSGNLYTTYNGSFNVIISNY